DAAALDVQSEELENGQSIQLTVTNQGGRRVTTRIYNRYSGKTVDRVLNPAETMTRHWNAQSFGGWYELVITVLDDPQFAYRVAGHIEAAEHCTTDPLMGGLL